MFQVIFWLIVGFYFLPRLFMLMAHKADIDRKVERLEEKLEEKAMEIARLEALREALIEWRRRGYPGECPELNDIGYPSGREFQRLFRQARNRTGYEIEGDW